MIIRYLFLIILLSLGVATLANGQDTNLELEAQGTEQQEKDFWDKVDSSSTMVPGLLVGLIGAFATIIYNARQTNIQRVETVEKFFTHLASDKPPIRKAALDAIAALGDEKLAMALAKHFGGKGSEEALKRLSTIENNKTAKRAKSALNELKVMEAKLKSMPD